MDFKTWLNCLFIDIDFHAKGTRLLTKQVLGQQQSGTTQKESRPKHLVIFGLT